MRQRKLYQIAIQVRRWLFVLRQVQHERWQGEQPVESFLNRHLVSIAGPFWLLNQSTRD